MSKQVLVTGVNGFVGHHLARELNRAGYEVLGTGKDKTLDSALDPFVDRFYPECDLTNPDHVAKLPLDAVDSVINLAGLANVGASYDAQQAKLYLSINVLVHTSIAERLTTIKRPVRVLAISTGAVYDPSQTMPITENGKIAKQGSPYVVSKVDMEEALRPYIEMGQDIVIVRPFNHIGPGQLQGLLVPDLIGKLRNMGPENAIQVGQLDTKRDYSDVRDVVRAYRMLATEDNLNHRIYNVCSGLSHSGQEILDTLVDLMGLTGVTTKLDPSQVRPAGTDPSDIYGDNSRIKQDTGWEPQIPIRQTLQDCLEP